MADTQSKQLLTTTAGTATALNNSKSKGKRQSSNINNDDDEQVVAGVPLLPRPGTPYHPQSLRLLLVQLVHRHGERSPLQRDFSGLVITQSTAEDSHPASDYTRDCLSSIPLCMARGDGSSANYIPVVSDPTGSGLISAPETDSGAFPSFAGACFTGQLTDTGRSSMRALGNYFRGLYVDRLGFLPPAWDDPQCVHLRSTHFPRTIESLHAFLAGLYPDGARQHIPEIHMRAADMLDNMVLPVSCARMDEMRRKFEKTVYQRLCDEGGASSWPKQIRSVLEHPNAAGESTPKYLHRTFDSLASAIAHSKPTRLRRGEFGLMSKTMAETWFGSMQGGGLAPRLMGGRFAYELFELVENRVGRSHNQRGTRPPQRITKPHYDPRLGTAINSTSASSAALASQLPGSGNDSGKGGPLLSVYSGHDSTIAPLLGGLGIWAGRWPPFGSHVTIELYENTATRPGRMAHASAAQSPHYVRVKYNEGAARLPACAAADKHYPGDPTLCSYEAFADVMRGFAVGEQEHRKQCRG